MTTRLSFSFCTDPLTERQVEKIYADNPDIANPNYPKGVLWKSESESVELVWFVLIAGNETYLIKSDPNGEEWYKITGYG